MQPHLRISVLGILLHVAAGTVLAQTQDVLQVYVDVGDSMGKPYMLDRAIRQEVASALRPFLQKLLTGDDAWTPLPQNTAIYVDAFCTKQGLLSTERRLDYRVGPTPPPYSKLDTFRRIGGADVNSNVRALLEDLSANPRTVVVVFSNSRDLSRAMPAAPGNVIVANLPEKSANNMGAALQKELEDALAAVRNRRVMRRQIVWQVKPTDRSEVLIQGRAKQYLFAVRNGMRWPISNVVCRVQRIDGTASYETEPGRISRLAPGEVGTASVLLTATEATGNATRNVIATFVTEVSPTSSARHLSTSERQLRLRVVTPAQPVAQFEAEPESGEPPLTVAFRNHSGKASRYEWTFGDGGSSMEASPSHTYETLGTYTVVLTALGENGSHDVVKREIRVVEEVLPTAHFEYQIEPETGVAPCTIQFSNLSTNAASFQWDLGNGETSTEMDPSARFAEPGMYTIRLVAKAENGRTDEHLERIEIHAPFSEVLQQKPVVDFTIASPVRVGEALRITNLTRFAFEYEWDFGDRSMAVSYQKIPVGIRYERPSTYDVTLTAWSTNRTHRNARAAKNSVTVQVAKEGGAGWLIPLAILADVGGIVLLARILSRPKVTVVYHRDGMLVGRPIQVRGRISLKDQFQCSQDLWIQGAKNRATAELGVVFESREQEARLAHLETREEFHVESDAKIGILPLGYYRICSAGDDEVEIRAAGPIAAYDSETGDPV